MLLPELLAILVCPACKRELDYHNEEERLQCHACGLAYPVRDGIPVLLVDQAEKIQ